MKNNVIKFEKKDHHASGEAFCFKCRKEWVAVAPVGTVQLECPECHTMKGLFKFPFNVEVGQLVRECNCGNQLFYLTPEGHLCANCGIYQLYD
jgi:hypothetical protein